MKRKRYTEEQIISILKGHEAGTPVADLARQHGIVENTIYRWKSKYGGMEVSDACQWETPKITCLGLAGWVTAAGCGRPGRRAVG